MYLNNFNIPVFDMGDEPDYSGFIGNADMMPNTPNADLTNARLQQTVTNSFNPNYLGNDDPFSAQYGRMPNGVLIRQQNAVRDPQYDFDNAAMMGRSFIPQQNNVAPTINPTTEGQDNIQPMAALNMRNYVGAFPNGIIDRNRFKLGGAVEEAPLPLRDTVKIDNERALNELGDALMTRELNAHLRKQYNLHSDNNDSDYYTIGRGDTLRNIAKAYGMSVKDIAKLNGIDNPNMIRAGRKLRLNNNVRATYFDNIRKRLAARKRTR